MVAFRLIFEQKKLILKGYWKCECTDDVQKQFTWVFLRDLPKQITIIRIGDKFKIDGTAQIVNEKSPREPFLYMTELNLFPSIKSEQKDLAILGI